MAELRLDNTRRIKGSGPVDHVYVTADAEAGAKGWVAAVQIDKVLARRHESRLDFLRGQVVEGEKGKGTIRYALRRGRGYLASTMHEGRAVRHPFVVFFEGDIGFCATEEALAEWVMAREGRDYAAEKQAALEAAAAVEAADPLPPLTGSDKQVAWATEVRRAFVIRRPQFREKVLVHTDARWWIDNAADLKVIP